MAAVTDTVATKEAMADIINRSMFSRGAESPRDFTGDKVMKKLFVLVGLIIIFGGVLNARAQDSLKSTVKKEKTKMGHKQMGHKQMPHKMPFVDADGDGYNDNAPDDDGDGIPNSLDPDYVKEKHKKGFRDMNGDGIDDRLQPEMKGHDKGRMMGPGMNGRSMEKGMEGREMDGDHRKKGHGKGRKGMN